MKQEDQFDFRGPNLPIWDRLRDPVYASFRRLLESFGPGVREYQGHDPKVKPWNEKIVATRSPGDPPFTI